MSRAARFLLIAALCLLGIVPSAFAQNPGQTSGCPLVTQPQIVSVTSYTLSTNDKCTLVVFTNPGNITITLPAPGLIFPPGWAASVLPINGGTITFTGAPDDAGKVHKINQQTSLPMTPAGTGADLLVMQDSNWWARGTGGGAGGNIVGPLSSTSADIACWNNALGTLLKDCGFVQSQAAPTAGTAAINTLITAAISGGFAGLQLSGESYAVASATTGADGSAVALLLSGLPANTNFTLDGRGSTLSLSAADIANFANIIQVQSAGANSTVTLKDLTLQYASPPFAQATLTSTTACVANANGVATFQMLSGFAPTFTHAVRVDDYNPTTGLFIVDALQFASQASAGAFVNTGGGSYTLAVNGSAQCTELAAMTNGHSYTILSQQFGNECVNVYHAANIVLDNVRVINCAGTGFQFNGAQDITFRNGTGTYYGGSGARLTANGNCIAINYASGIVTADATTRMLGCDDDGFFAGVPVINITTVTSVTNITLTGLPYVLVGDTLQFVDGNGVFKGTAVISGITISGGNTVVTLTSPGAPATPTTSWFVYDASQAPSSCKIDGLYGNNPTRGIFAMCGQTMINSPTVQNTFGGGIVSDYGNTLDGVGPVPTTVTINGPTLTGTNYGNVAPGAITVMGGNNTSNGPATAGQISSVNVNDETCINTASSCLYISAAGNTSFSGIKSTNWNTANAPPTYAQTGSGSLNTNAIALLNDSGVSVGPNQYTDSTGLLRLGTGSNVTFKPGGFNDPATGLISYTPVATCGSGSLTTSTSNGFYLPMGSVTYVTMNLTITNHGSCATSITLSLPVTASQNAMLVGRENVNTGKGLQGFVLSSGTTAAITDMSNGFVMADGDAYSGISGLVPTN